MTVIPAPLRSQVREAIARAWDAAIESGGLPALPDDVARPAIEVEHPTDPSHGDLATNLAMKLARRSLCGAAMSERPEFRAGYPTCPLSCTVERNFAGGLFSCGEEPWSGSGGAWTSSSASAMA